MARGRGHLKVCSLTILEPRLDSQPESAGNLTTCGFRAVIVLIWQLRTLS